MAIRRRFRPVRAYLTWTAVVVAIFAVSAGAAEEEGMAARGQHPKGYASFSAILHLLVLGRSVASAAGATGVGAVPLASRSTAASEEVVQQFASGVVVPGPDDTAEQEDALEQLRGPRQDQCHLGGDTCKKEHSADLLRVAAAERRGPEEGIERVAVVSDADSISSLRLQPDDGDSAEGGNSFSLAGDSNEEEDVEGGDEEDDYHYEEGDDEGEDDEGSYDEDADEDSEPQERDAATEWTVLEYWTLLGCEEHYRQNPVQPIHDLATWFYLRGLYTGIVAGNFPSVVPSDDDSVDDSNLMNNATITSTTPLEMSFRRRRQQRIRQLRDDVALSKVSWNQPMARQVGFQVPVSVRHTQQRGRGVFVDRDVQADEIVSVGGDEARFLDAFLYRRFVEAAPVELQCDLLQFSYFDVEVMDNEEEERDVILVALNDEAYLNADWSTTDGSEANLIGVEYDVVEANDSNAPYRQHRRIEYVARRDIKAGEELLLKYTDFLHGDGWHVFGL